MFPDGRNFDIDFRNLGLILRAITIDTYTDPFSCIPPVIPIVEISKSGSVGDNDYLPQFAATRLWFRGAEVNQSIKYCNDVMITVPFITKLIFGINDALADNEMIAFEYDPSHPGNIFTKYSYRDNENTTITVNKLEPSRLFRITELISEEYIERISDPMFGFEYWGTISLDFPLNMTNDGSLRIFKIEPV